MSTISVQEIQHNPTDFLRRLEAGETLLVVRGDLPLAQVLPLPAPVSGTRPYGLCAGSFTVPADFDAPLPEGTLDTFQRSIASG